MYYSFKNLPIFINGQEILTDNLSLSTSASLVPVYDVGNALNKEYKPNNGIQGSLSITYYPTGIDLVKNCINRTYTNLSGYIGGFYFNSGYLSNYKLTANPNSPIIANSEILFFEELKGVINPSSPKNISENILNFNDIRLINSSNENVGNLNSLNYTYNCDIKPVYYIGNQTGVTSISPDRIAIGEKVVTVDFITDSSNLLLSYTGKSNVGLTLQFSSPKTPGYIDNLHCSGTLDSKILSAKAGENVKKSFSLIENNIYDIPKVISFSPDTASWGADIQINGENLDLYPLAGFTLDDALTNGGLFENLTVLNSTTMVGKLPTAARTNYGKGYFIIGDNKLITTQTTGKFTVIYPEISVSSINPNSYGRNLESGKNILITGSNFYYINKVSFSGVDAEFDVISPTSINCNLPNYVISSKIAVISEEMGKSGLSPMFFMPAFVSGFSPLTGYSGTLFSISGRNFSDVATCYIGNRSGIFAKVNDNLITGQIPSGNTYGQVSLYLSAGTRLRNQQLYNFTPILRITGCNPSSGKYLTPVTLTTSELIDPELLLRTGEVNTYTVYFGGTPTGFIQTSGYTLTGLVPSGFISGQISFGVPTGGGVVYPVDSTNASYFAIYNPVITAININSPLRNNLVSGKSIGQGFTQSYYIEGANFYNVTGILFSGTTGYTNSGNHFYVVPPNLNIQNSSFISIEGYTLTGVRMNTGMYNLHLRTREVEVVYPSGLYIEQAPNLALRSFVKSSGSGAFSRGGFLYDTRIARNGISGGNSGNYGIYLSSFCFNPMFEIDLGSTFPEINKIELYNSNSTGQTFQDTNNDARLFSGVYVQLLNNNRTPVYHSEVFGGTKYIYSGDGTINKPFTGIHFTNRSGRYVRVQITGLPATQLPLAEIRIF